MRELRVGDVMTTDVVTAGRDQSLKEIARLMYDHRVSGLPIVDEDRRLVGIVSEADLLRSEATGQRTEPRSLFLEWLLHPRRLEEWERRGRVVRAGDVMVTDVATVGPDTTLGEATRILLRHGVKRLPVVDEESRVVGIVSRQDLLSPFLTEEPVRPDPGSAN
jgi:CBS-domain-containing membrane protein